MRWLRKVFWALVVLFVVFYLVTRPADAATAVRGVFNALAKAVSAIFVFFTSLAG
jgi:hypothetical protein